MKYTSFVNETEVITSKFITPCINMINNEVTNSGISRGEYFSKNICKIIDNETNKIVWLGK